VTRSNRYAARALACLLALSMTLMAQPTRGQIINTIELPCNGYAQTWFCAAQEEIAYQLGLGNYLGCQDCVDVLCGVWCVTNYTQFRNCLTIGYIECIEAMWLAQTSTTEKATPVKPLVQDKKPTMSLDRDKVIAVQAASRQRVAELLVKEGDADGAMHYLSVCTLLDKLKFSGGLTEAEIRQLVGYAKQKANSLAVCKAMSGLLVLMNNGKLPSNLRPEMQKIARAGLKHEDALVRAPSIALMGALEGKKALIALRPLLHDPHQSIAKLAQSVTSKLEERVG
jgi:hypothetical protein